MNWNTTGNTGIQIRPTLTTSYICHTTDQLDFRGVEETIKALSSFSGMRQIHVILTNVCQIMFPPHLRSCDGY